MVTIMDVAREAGVSPATVSRAFNKHPSVGADYVRRVRDAAKKLGYRPNQMASNLRKKTSNVIALIIPDVGNSFHTAIARGVEDIAQEAGLSVLLGNSDENVQREARYLDVAESQRAAGVLLCPHDPNVDISRIVDATVPIVAIDRRLSAEVDSVTSSSYEGAYEVTVHLAEEGWERISCCAGPTTIETARNRVAGYLDAMRDLGLSPMVIHSGYDRQSGAESAVKLLDRPDTPDAFFTSNEQLALGVLQELRRRGLRLGKDVGMATFDDTPWAPLIEPPMTVVEQPAYEIGAQAARMLNERIRDDSYIPARHVELSTRLIVRGSSIKS